MQLWSRQEVREDVVDARTVAGVERYVVFNRDVQISRRSPASRGDVVAWLFSTYTSLWLSIQNVEQQ